MARKEFTLKYEFKNVWKLRELQDNDCEQGAQYIKNLEGEKNLLSPREEHFGLTWDMTILRFSGRFMVFLAADCTGNQRIHVDYTTKIFSKNQETTHSVSGKQVLTENTCADCIFDWRTVENECLNDGKLEVEIHVNIIKLVGFQEEMEDEIDDNTVEGILKVSDIYEEQLAIKKCEKYLMEKSKMELKKKLELAGKYRLEELKKVCLDQIKTKEDIQSVIPDNASEMDHEIMAEILKKTFALI